MSWLLESVGHQQPWHWRRNIGKYLSSVIPISKDCESVHDNGDGIKCKRRCLDCWENYELSGWTALNVLSCSCKPIYDSNIFWGETVPLMTPWGPLYLRNTPKLVPGYECKATFKHSHGPLIRDHSMLPSFNLGYSPQNIYTLCFVLF